METKIVQLAVSGNLVYALDANGSAWFFGENGWRQLPNLPTFEEQTNAHMRALEAQRKVQSS